MPPSCQVADNLHSLLYVGNIHTGNGGVLSRIPNQDKGKTTLLKRLNEIAFTVGGDNDQSIATPIAIDAETARSVRVKQAAGKESHIMPQGIGSLEQAGQN